MTDPDLPDSRAVSPMADRIRNRRIALGLSGSSLARHAGISPSYVSLIERGHKVPDEDVAARLAAVLEDDQDLYRAWARGERYGLEGLASLQRLDDLTSDARTSRILASGRDLPRPLANRSPASALARPLRSLFSAQQSVVGPEEAAGAAKRGARSEGAGADELPELAQEETLLVGQAPAFEADEEPAEPVPDRVVEVPVLRAGEDPRRMLDALSHPPLHLDSRLVGSSESGGLFAYELDRAAAARLGEIASEGGYVVLTRRIRRLTSERVYAVRGEDEGIRLGRVLFKGNSLLVLPPAGGSDIEVVPIREGESWRERVLGVVVLSLKRWR